MIVPEIASVFTVHLAPYISTLLNEGRVGICGGAPRIAEVNTGSSPNTDTRCMDRFKVVIPYAGCSITWEVIFNGQYPETPPDFIFGPEEPDFINSVKIENLKSLIDWQPNDARSLLTVIEEILDEYSSYQRQLVKTNSRLMFEYSSLIENNFKPEDVEVHISKSGQNRFGPVNFLIKLPIDFSRIPTYLTKDNPGEDTAVILVTFQHPEDSKVTPQLYLSPRVEYVLGGSSTLRIPAYPTGGCLIDYVPTVCELLKNKVDIVVQTFEKRRECISAFLSAFGTSVVEYDAEAFTKASFLLEWHDFFFGFTLELPNNYPKDSPIYHFQSVYHEAEDGKPYNKTELVVPYSPRWSTSEMAERARTYVLDHIVQFQRGSVTEGSL